jgi:DNA polymerase-1
VIVAFYASAELGCFRALGWRPPLFVLDLFTEFRARTNGYSLPHGASLLGTLTYFGLDGIAVTEKRDLRNLILSGGPWSADDREVILLYCESDVIALKGLLPVMLSRIDLPHALLRGRFMKAAAAIEWNGTPIDVGALERLRRHWTGIQDALGRCRDRLDTRLLVVRDDRLSGLGRDWSAHLADQLDSLFSSDPHVSKADPRD